VQFLQFPRKSLASWSC